jgi:hypothetical protein
MLRHTPHFRQLSKVGTSAKERWLLPDASMHDLRYDMSGK